MFFEFHLLHADTLLRSCSPAISEEVIISRLLIDGDGASDEKRFPGFLRQCKQLIDATDTSEEQLLVLLGSFRRSESDLTTI
jgi:hypothetical protein